MDEDWGEPYLWKAPLCCFIIYVYIYIYHYDVGQNFGDETSRFLSRTFPWKNDRLHRTFTGGFKRRLRWGAHHLIGVGSQVPTPDHI